MNRLPVFVICVAVFSAPLISRSLVTSTPADSVKKVDSVAKTATVDKVKVVVDTVVKKDCFTEYYHIFRSKGAKAVADRKQDVVIALKGDGTCHCFIGQVEVAGGKIKPPLMIQQENGGYKQITVVGKKRGIRCFHDA
ncbi:hypothetical protein [Pollutibacter soli]|uniref:hypothetical protein n=1 Tax=Pollutibacter soli TaxID=3034157 RepID=UPI00301401D3